MTGNVIMGTTMWILLLCAVPAALSLKDVGTRWTLKEKLVDSVQTLPQTTGSCKQLSESIGSLIRYSSVIPNVIFEDVLPPISQREMEQILEMVFGFDVVKDHEARDEFVCSITQSRTLSELKKKFEDRGILYDLFKFTYDSTSVWMRILKQRTSDPRVLDFINELETSGLLDLDQSGVEWLSKLVVPHWSVVDYNPVSSFSGPSSIKCSQITHSFITLVREKLQSNPKYEMIIRKIKQITGVDITDKPTMEEIICDLVDGASGGIQGLWERIKNLGVVRKLVTSGYQYVKIYGPTVRYQLEILMQRDPITPISSFLGRTKYVPHIPEDYPIPSLYNNIPYPSYRRRSSVYGRMTPYDIPYPRYLRRSPAYGSKTSSDIPFPTHFRHTSVYEEMPQFRLITDVPEAELMQLVVDFLWKLEATTLLRLPIDL